MSSEHGALALLGLKGIGRVSVRSWLSSGVPLGTLEEVNLCLSSSRKNAIEPEIIQEAWEKAGLIISRSSAGGIDVTACDSPTFPKQLKNIPDAPAVIFSKGVLPPETELGVAVVGTRHPSEWGRKAARKIARTLADNGIVVVSGLAEGCDTEAHRGCIDAGGRTIALLAHGFGEIYPKSNTSLAEEILRTGGCLITEYPLGTPILRSSFVERDRLQSGLSAAVLVIETDVEGGTMHTVGFAEKQDRVLAALKHPPDQSSHPKVRGNEILINTGRAEPISDSADLIALANRLLSSIGVGDEGQMGLL